MLTHTTDFPKVLLLQLVLGAYKLLISFLCSIVIFFYVFNDENTSAYNYQKQFTANDKL